MKIFKAISLSLFSLLLVAALGMAAGGEVFKTKLSGTEAIPAVTTSTTGEATFAISKDGKEITYELKLQNIENVTAAHIHKGKKGVEGPPVAGLFSGPKKEGKFTGVLAKGTITDKNLVGPLAGKTIDDLVAMIKSGEAYVNVHTTMHPASEVRGQIE